MGLRRRHSGHISSFAGARRIVMPVVMVAALASTVVGGQAASAGNQGTFPRAFNPETAPGYTNTFTPPTSRLTPQCPNGIAGTPGSDPANKVLNSALNTPSSFQPGGTVHYTYTDNPHGSAFGFDIQDCEVEYPPNFFQASDFDPTTGVLINPAFSKAVLDQNGTMIDGAELSGISNPEGNIYFSWTVQPAPAGSWICNFARDINTDHGGGGNRKVTPTCFQVATPTPPPSLTVSAAYADSFRSGTGPQFPTPWGSSSTVTFVGCGFGGTDTCPRFGTEDLYDSGALLITNTGATTFTLTGASVTIGSCVFDPWGTLSVAVAPGDSAILTQTGGSPECGLPDTPVGNYNFDTSESDPNPKIGPPNPALCSTNDGIVPQVTIDISGSGPATYSDTAQVLNDQGTDPGDPTCNGGTEFQPWTLIS